MATYDDDIPAVPVLLLGDEGVGKSTFLASVYQGSVSSSPWLTVHHSRLTLSNRRLPPGQALPVLRDSDQPIPFNVRFHKRQLRLEFYDTSYPENYTLLRPGAIVLCFAIDDYQSLVNVQTRWKHIIETHFNHDESIPIILLALKRDVRSKEDYSGSVKPLTKRAFTYPQEGVQTAQEMRLDRYCECSALTGELCHEVFEDISKTAAMTLTKEGGRSLGTQCTIL